MFVIIVMTMVVVVGVLRDEQVQPAFTDESLGLAMIAIQVDSIYRHI